MTESLKKDIPMAVVRRMTRYYRYLLELENNNILKISSQAFAEKLGLTASQVRQDFGYFGAFGHKGYGYEVSFLKDTLVEILGIKKIKTCILIGAGNLGKTILSLNYENLGFELIGVFDKNTDIIDSEFRGYKISNSDDIEQFCKAEKPDVAILCIPTSSAEILVNRLYNLGIKNFWNFSHYDISMMYNDVKVENVHLKDSMMTLRFLIEQ